MVGLAQQCEINPWKKGGFYDNLVHLCFVWLFGKEKPTSAHTIFPLFWKMWIELEEENFGML